MKPKTLIPFLVVLAVLGALVAYQKSQKKADDIVEQSGLQQVTAEAISPESVKKIELNTGAAPDEKLVLQKEGEEWIVASNFNAPVKKDVIDAYLKKLTGMRGEPRATAADEAGLDAYKLKDADAFHVRAYTTGDEPALHLLFGKAPDFKSVFFRKEGEMQVYVEANDLRKEAGVTGEDMAAKPTPDKWLNKDVVKVEQEKVTKLAFHTPDKDYTIEKKVTQAQEAKTEGEGETATQIPPVAGKIEFVMAAGGIGEPGKEVKTTAVERVFGRLKALSASNLVDPAKKADFGLDNPPFKLTISREGESDIVLLGAHKDPAGPGHLMIEGDAKGVVYELSKFNFEYLFLKGGDLYDLPKFDLEAEKIDRIEVTGPDGPVNLKKDGEEWKADNIAFAIDQQKVKDLATAVAKIQMQDYADQPQAYTHSVTVHAGDVTRTLQGGGPASNFEGVYAGIDGDTKSYAIAKADADKIFVSPGGLYRLDAFSNVQATAINSITLVQDGKRVELKKDGEEWTVTADGAPFKGDAMRIGSLTDQLATLRFAGVAGDGAAIATPFIDVEFSTTDGGTHSLSVGTLEGESHLAKADGNATLFKLEAEKADTLKYNFNAVQTPASETPAESPDAAGDPHGGLPPGAFSFDPSSGGGLPEGITLPPPPAQ